MPKSPGLSLHWLPPGGALGMGTNRLKKGTDAKKDLSHLLGLWFLAIHATSRPGLPYFASLKPHGVPRLNPRSSQQGLFAPPENVFLALTLCLCAQSSPWIALSFLLCLSKVCPLLL